MTDTCNKNVSSSHLVAPQFEYLCRALLSQWRKDRSHNTVSAPMSHFAPTDFLPFVRASNTQPKSHSSGYAFVTRRLGPAVMAYCFIEGMFQESTPSRIRTTNK